MRAAGRARLNLRIVSTIRAGAPALDAQESRRDGALFSVSCRSWRERSLMSEGPPVIRQ
jgi:hypothetical protein